MKIFEDRYTVFQRFFKGLSCFFIEMNKLKIFKELLNVFIKIFENFGTIFKDKTFSTVLIKKFLIFCKDICFIIEINKSKILNIFLDFPQIKIEIRNLYTGSNLDLLCVRQLDGASFCENYAKLYCDASYLEKILNRRW